VVLVPTSLNCEGPVGHARDDSSIGFAGPSLACYFPNLSQAYSLDLQRACQIRPPYTLVGPFVFRCPAKRLNVQHVFDDAGQRGRASLGFACAGGLYGHLLVSRAYGDTRAGNRSPAFRGSRSPPAPGSGPPRGHRSRLIASRCRISPKGESSQYRATEQSQLFLEKAMSNRSRDAGVGVVLDDIAYTVAQQQPQTAHTLAIVASINRLVKRDGALSGGRACLASMRAASRRIQPSIGSGLNETGPG
jgi:hypothetical protein